MTEKMLGVKMGMTQVYADDGKIAAVTAIEAGPCTVTQIKSTEKDGYEAVQIGFGEAKGAGKAKRGHRKSKGRFKYLRESGVSDDEALEEGQAIDVSIFKAGDRVDITGTSKGKGFAGTIKRHHFRGGPKTHGQSDRERAVGSVGAGSSPGRVFKGKRMPGHMGHQQVTVRNLEIYRADAERNLLLVKGAVPGGNNGLVMIKKSGKEK